MLVDEGAPASAQTAIARTCCWKSSRRSPRAGRRSGVSRQQPAIQVHGGYGYTKEFDVEQGYRDNRLNAIHEGTHGIHGLDLLGRKVVMQDGAA